MTDKPWKKPELLVLLRYRPEECILSNCKWNANGPNALAGGCFEAGCPSCFQNMSAS